MQRSISTRAIALAAVVTLVAIFLSVVAARTEVIAIVDTGDGDPIAMATLALLDSNGATPITPSQGDNYAVALNTQDGTTLVETAFLITYAANGVVDQTNAAVAYSSCELCRTFAAAIEVVLVPAEKADTVTPTNLAVAVNEDCLSCETGAFATQIVLGVDGPVGFTEEGNEQLEQIQEDLAALEEQADELTLEEFKALYDEIVARLKEVLANELVPIGNSGQDKRENEQRGDEETILEEPTPESTEGTEPEVTTEETTVSPVPGSAAPEQTTPAQTAPEETTPPPGSTSSASPAAETTSSASPSPEESAPASPEPQQSTPASPTPEESAPASPTPEESASPAPGGSTVAQ